MALAIMDLWLRFVKLLERNGLGCDLDQVELPADTGKGLQRLVQVVGRVAR